MPHPRQAVGRLEERGSVVVGQGLREGGLEEAMTTSQVIDYLTYRCYFFNRMRSPEISPERYKAIGFPNVDEMEEQYQQETKNERSKA
jgi:hypothetical protein